MIVVFNLLALAILGAGLTVGAVVGEVTGSVLAMVIVACVVAAAIDVAIRRRQRKGLFAVDGGGLMVFLPVWLFALAALLATALVATALPPGWDRPARGAVDAGR
jgi:amino acid transporter